MPPVRPVRARPFRQARGRARACRPSRQGRSSASRRPRQRRERRTASACRRRPRSPAVRLCSLHPPQGRCRDRPYVGGAVLASGGHLVFAAWVPSLSSGFLDFDSVMLGRAQERWEIEHALDVARSGASACLVLTGEPGIGKTALLYHAAEQATGMQVLRARGIESEAQIPFASLLELLRPALVMIERVPPPQADRARRRAGVATREGAGALRGRRGDAQPARRPRRTAAAGDPDRRCALARRVKRSGVAVRLPPVGGRPDRGDDRGP